MSKKLKITLIVVFSVVAVLLILFWTLFALSSVTVEYHSTKQNITLSDAEIVEAGNFRKGACVLFEGKNKSIESIYAAAENNENFAYIRVVNIETVFPNKFVVHVAEREELFAVQISDDGQDVTYICDRDLRVLREDENFESTQGEAILLTGLSVTNENIKIGDFLSVKEESIKKLYSAMLENGRDLAAQRGKFKQIDISTYQDEVTGKEYCSLSFTTYQDRSFVLNNPDFALSAKVQLMFAAESALWGHAVDAEGNFVDESGQNMLVVALDAQTLGDTKFVSYVTYDEEEHAGKTPEKLSFALLGQCFIKVDNLTLSDYVSRTENDIYYSICKKV